MKKVLSVFLSFVMIISIFSTTSIQALAIGNYGADLDTANYSANNPFSWGQCTWYAYGRALEKTGTALPYRGNAKTWTSGAVSTPRANSVVVWTGGEYGHVAFVEAYDGTNIYISEANRVSLQYSEGVINLSTRRFTYTYGGSGGYTVDLPYGYIYLGESPNSPTGTLDIVEGKCGQIFVRGWAFDKDDTSKSIDIHVYVGADSTVAGGEGHVITANLERKDVNNAYGCGNNHGFSHTIDTNKTGSQTVYVYAINIGSGENILLGSKTVNISNPNPVGVLDIVEGKCGAVFVRGWAYDPNDTSKSIEIHVYVGGAAGSGGEGHVIKADRERNDVNNVYGCGKNHGFNNTISTKKNGSQSVYVYGINIGSGSNVLLGSKTVTIKSGHTWNSAVITKAPTCTETGIKTYTCASCGETKAEEISELGHKWNSGVVTKKSTPTGNGVMTLTCSVCGATKTETIAKCAKYANPIKASGKTATVKFKNLKKKNQTVAQKNAFSVTKAQGKVTYKKSSGNKNITVSSAGKITVKKGLKKGTYKIKVKVTAAGNATYKAGSKTVTVTIKVN